MDTVLEQGMLVLRQERQDGPQAVTQQVRRQWASGDHRGAYALAVQSTQDSLYRFLVHLLRDEEEAREVFQDTYVRVYRGLDGFRGEASLTTWVLRIGRNQAWTRRRGSKTRQAREVSLEAFKLDPPAREEPDRRELDHALARLPGVQREAVLLFYLEGLSVEEVARTTGRPANTIKSDLLRARAKLREHLQRTDTASASIRESEP
jgi:RNA polymerase sigma factor (sigma-70 family)